MPRIPDLLNAAAALNNVSASLPQAVTPGRMATVPGGRHHKTRALAQHVIKLISSETGRIRSASTHSPRLLNERTPDALDP